MKPKKWNVKKAKIHLDKIWSLAIRSRDGACRKCGSVNSLQAAHIFSRGNLSTRWDTSNGLTLCMPCHLYWGHRKPVEFTLWVMGILGKERFDTLKRKSQEIYDPSNFRADFEEIRKSLTAL